MLMFGRYSIKPTFRARDGRGRHFLLSFPRCLSLSPCLLGWVAGITSSSPSPCSVGVTAQLGAAGSIVADTKGTRISSENAGEVNNFLLKFS